MILSVDFETKSDIDLLKAGVYRYAESEHADIWCMAYAFDDGEPEIWWQGDPIPADIEMHIAAGGEMRAWNAQFERVMWKKVLTPKYGFTTPKDEQWHDTAAEAAAMSLPMKLDKAAEVCRIAMQKDKVGNRLAIKMSKPKKPSKKERAMPGFDPSVIQWHTMTPEIRRIMSDYCKQDVRAERGMYRCTRRLTPTEREVYLLDQRINDRGVYLDLPLVHAARRLAKRATNNAIEALNILTDGKVSSHTKVGDLKEWIENRGVAAPSLAKKSVAIILEKDIPEEVREAIRLRQEAGKASVKKLERMLQVVCADSRLHGLKLYHGAGTGRWAGRLVQPDNFPRGEIGKKPERFIDLVMAGAYEELDLFYPVLSIISSILRPMLTAAPGHDLLVADYAAVECRGVNWIAGQDDVLESFRKFDAAPKAEKPNFDPYRIMAVKMGRAATPAEVSDKDRQAGKAAELGCGFQMGWKKFITAAWDVYQVRVDAKESKLAVDIYRETHEKVKQFWKDVNICAIEAVAAPGSVHRCGRNDSIKLTYRGAYLYLILPSGRPLAYACPTIEEKEIPDTGGKTAPSVAFMGINQKTRQWQKSHLYGGLLTENIVQALCRDLLAEGMLTLDKSGFPPILHVHDEAIAEVPKSYPPDALERFENILRTPPTWAKDFPIMTEGWRGERYRK